MDFSLIFWDLNLDGRSVQGLSQDFIQGGAGASGDFFQGGQLWDDSKEKYTPLPLI